MSEIGVLLPGTMEKSKFHDTSTGTYISRAAHLFNTTNIEFPSGNVIVESGTVIRGDLAVVKIDRYSIIREDTVLRPSFMMTPGKTIVQFEKLYADVSCVLSSAIKFIPLHIGSCSYIGKSCVIESAVIGVGCFIGENCILGKRSILRDYVTVLPGSLIPPDMVIPPFSVVSGAPAVIVSENPESYSAIIPADAKERFKQITWAT